MSIRFPAVAAALLLLAPGASAATSKTWQQSFTVAGRPTVTITTNDGHVHVRTGPAGTVRSEVRYDGRHWGWTSPHRLPDVDLHQAGNAITVSAREPSVFTIFGGVWMKLDIDVVVPAECDLQIQTGDGPVTIEDPVVGQLGVRTGDGAIRVHGARGDLQLRAADGSITADSLDGSLSARTADGRVVISGRFDRLEVHTGDGRVDATAGRGSQLADGWRIETQDGSLTLRIPTDLKAELDARTGDGRIHFDLPVSVSGRLDPHAIHGLINGGGPPLRLRTSDGALFLAVSE